MSSFLGILMCLGIGEASAEEAEVSEISYAEETEVSARAPYVFGWLDYPSSQPSVRGGTTQGTPVVLDTEAGEQWRRLQEEGLSTRERDRRAILALAGEYRVSFDFLETEVYGEYRSPSTPYRSWATEKVYVVENSAERISLQHIIVMFFLGEDGEVMGPMVMKHWRQDWDFEPRSTLEFVGHGLWENRKLSRAERRGYWQQSVFQVDDSPRYSMRGRWSHHESFSIWEGEEAWRPLPRREFSVRSDYQALVGSNQITINPWGWTHSQDNLKAVLAGAGDWDVSKNSLAREWGLNRYERILGFDFSEGDAYWTASQEFWTDVRAGWKDRVSAAERIRIQKTCDGTPSFSIFFELADSVPSTPAEQTLRDAQLSKVLDCVVQSIQE